MTIFAPVATMILIVDDDEATRDSLRFLLECEGIESVVFDSARSFLQSPAFPSVDCLVVDVNMSDMNGIALLEHLRKQGVQLPAIVVTGSPGAETTRRALAAGAMGVFEKPFDTSALVEAIRCAVLPAGRY
jgi:FixJ family two-component response regulator